MIARRFVALAVLAAASLAHGQGDVPPPESEPEEAPIPVEPTPPPPLAMPSVPTLPAPVKPVAEPTPVDRPAWAPWPTSRFAVDLDVVSHARYASKSGANLSEVRLDRGELGARIALGMHGAGELRLEAIRSATEGGALGIDGDSTVVRVKLANVGGRIELGPVAIDGVLGFVPDPWIRTIEEGYSLKPLSRTGSERLLAWPTADLAVMARAAIGPARLSVSIGNGEGQDYPERNTGKTTTIVGEAVPLRSEMARVVVAAMFRDGSVGVARIRERRFGGALSAITRWASAGVEVVSAQGIGDRGDAEGLELAGWVDGKIVDRVFVAGRIATLGFTDGGRATSLGGGLAVEPWRGTSPFDRKNLRLWLALDRITSSGNAMPLPGEPGDATIIMLIASANAPFTVD